MTLIDTLYRASFSKHRNPGWSDNAKWRDALRRAKRFVLDEDMSVFLGELCTTAFIRPKMSQAAKVKTIEHLRMCARLPSDITWIEYDLRKSLGRSNELLGRPFDPKQTPAREGWLLMRHPHLENAFQAVIVSHDPDVDHGDGFNLWTFPVALAWTTDMDTVMPWKPLPTTNKSAALSEIASGLIGYKTERSTICESDMLVLPKNTKAVTDLLQEWTGVQRRMWSLLATINDLPVEVTDVRAAKGFIGKGQYRKFLDHKTITLTVPTTKYSKVIRNALALAHRRGGTVRSHWRLDWRHPLSPLCDHDWGADDKHMFCNHCHGRKIWVVEHVRGDTSRGFVTTDFNVTHEAEVTAP